MKPTYVRTASGEEFVVAGGSTDEGVPFDGGTIPWDQVLAFLVWSREWKRYFSIPVDSGDAQGARR